MRQILLRRRKKIIVPTFEQEHHNECYVASINKNIEDLGFCFSKDLFNALSQCDIDYLKDIYEEICSLIAEMVGADLDYRPMYPNFPKSVMQRNEYELYFNALIHYWTGGQLIPYEQVEARELRIQRADLKVIDLGTMEELRVMIENLMQSKTPLSRQDVGDIEWYMRRGDIVLPEEIPLKEVCAFVVSQHLLKHPEVTSEELKKYFSTATDVLRLAVGLSGGDVSLEYNTKFISFPNRQRKILLELLENCSSIEEDMRRNKTVWIRLGERLHPRKYKHLSKVNIAFEKLRNNEPIYVWKSLVNMAIEAKEYEKAVSLLKQRPGEFARALDYILRISDDKDMVLDSFKKISDKVSSNVLLQLMKHFKNRDGERYILLGHRVYFITKEVAPIEEGYCLKVVEVCKDALLSVYKEREYLGKVYLSSEYERFMIPTGLKTASKAYKTYTRGSRISINNHDRYLRSFIWWTNTEDECIDVDLSVLLLDEKYRYVDHISYTNLKAPDLGCYHSGDIVNGGDIDGPGVSEFIDLDTKLALEKGVRYLVFGVYNYTCVPFSQMQNIKFGWMEREDSLTGEIFEPSTVKQRIDLFCETRNSAPIIFDCFKREFIWLDISLIIDDIPYQNVECSLGDAQRLCKHMVEHQEMSLYDLVSLHILARGEQVDNKEDADTIFDLNEGITPFDLDVFVGEYL